MTPLFVRAISALIAIILIAGSSILYGTQGLVAMCFLVILLVTVEYAWLIFARPTVPGWLQWLFRTLSLLTAIATVVRAPLIAPVIMLDMIILAAAAIWALQKSDDLAYVLNQIGLMVMGVIYCGLLPGTVVALLFLPHGRVWFFAHLAIVFSGDTFAYFAGKTWGERKLFPSISPKKTVAGSVGGLIGSCLAIVVVYFYFLNQVPLLFLIGAALATGLFAQMGDIFESLVKRVAHVKDSSHLMPGHGGIMDRLDGVFFAVPIFYLAASYFSAVFL